MRLEWGKMRNAKSEYCCLFHGLFPVRQKLFRVHVISEQECTGEKYGVLGGYKESSRSSSDCLVCTCEVNESYRVDLFISSDKVNLGDDYTMTIINASTGKARVTRVEYNIIDPRDNSAIPLGISSSLSKTVRAYSPGHWRVQAVATFSIGYPDRGGKYFVGTFHIHPARTPCDNTVRYRVGPSPVDNNMNTVCLLYDYVGESGLVKGGHDPRVSHKLYHYGTYKNTPCGKERHPLL